jgi:hypothetical protein
MSNPATNGSARSSDGFRSNIYKEVKSQNRRATVKYKAEKTFKQGKKEIIHSRISEKLAVYNKIDPED